MTKLSRELRATNSASTLSRGRDFLACEDDIDAKDVTPFDFRNWYSKSALNYKPNFSSVYFQHRGNIFHWSSSQRPSLCGEGYDRAVRIRCLGRSTDPIKKLLQEVKGFTLTKDSTTTEIYRCSVKSESCQWLRQTIRSARPMHTVLLDEEQKAHIISDVNEYLQPCTEQWYASRGIPYRRGYLFHGPPGSGKTSLSFALAGLFGLSIYCVSLSEPGLSESQLATLFSILPQRCIVLLEDIDSAGLHREGGDWPNADELQGTRLTARRVKSLITLAGLLNIIDGAASQEVSTCPALAGRSLLTQSEGTRTDHDHQPSLRPRHRFNSTGSYRPSGCIHSCYTQADS